MHTCSDDICGIHGRPRPCDACRDDEADRRHDAEKDTESPCR